MDQAGYVDILIKVYRKTEEYPEGGELTTFLDELNEGDEMVISGPVGKCIYKGNGEFFFNREDRTGNYKKLTMIAGGSGITPFYQIIQHVRRNGDDVEISLIFANKTEGDILLREELDNLAKEDGVNVHYTVSSAEEGWTGSTGHVSEEMIKEHGFEPAEDHLVFHCGPKEFNVFVKGLLTNLGHAEGNIFKY